MTPDAQAAWQAALAAEHQAVFGYALLGPQLRGADLTRAVDGSDDHERRRDDVESAMVAAGVVPVQSRADYPSLYPVRTVAAARALAARLEQDCAAAWRYLYAVAARTKAQGQTVGQTHDEDTQSLREQAQQALTASAVAATRWLVAADSTRPTTAFPGLTVR